MKGHRDNHVWNVKILSQADLFKRHQGLQHGRIAMIFEAVDKHSILRSALFTNMGFQQWESADDVVIKRWIANGYKRSASVGPSGFLNFVPVKYVAEKQVAVQIAERWIMARLRHQTFFTLASLNQAIRPLLEDLNHRPFKKLTGTRRRRP